ncbi:hypothetical protein H5410_003227 [Solanum commersonii]|uniref:Uncharacterized protein n=1 Tax=Solanum commersonii TaxID=4109 RepID=A0A9J6B435_SOLCO|nr:hypothetical protein H5410_003227 [Solanum commersonii]
MISYHDLKSHVQIPTKDMEVEFLGSDLEGNLVAWKAGQLGQATTQVPRTTSRPVVLATARRSGREDYLALWRFSKVEGATA